MRTRSIRITLSVAAMAGTLVLGQEGERPKPPSEEIDGSPMYQVLPKDEIMAVYEPEFVFGAEADAQMQPHEPILGVFDGINARAYSLWQLDHHEVVDDTLGSVPIAATW